MTTQSLNGLNVLETGRILRINSEFDVRERLAALGLRPGRQVQVVRRLGARGPMQVRVDHTDIVVRAVEAASIDVELMA
jgi:ferrous iron transport protein A